MESPSIIERLFFMLKDFSFSAFYMGILATFVGYLASFAIVLTGIKAMGANDQQAALGLFLTTLIVGISCIVLPAIYKTPVAVSWSTPGAAFLISTSLLPGGYAAALGAIIMCSCLILLTGLIPSMAKAAASIPRPIANALLAGVLFKLCLAPASGFSEAPYLILPIVLAWVAGLMYHKLAAVPCAMIAFVIVFVMSSGGADYSSLRTNSLISQFDGIMPIFSFQGFISIALPLYFVTMAGQNIPGFTVLELNKFKVDRPRLLQATGVGSLVIAPFGGVPVNMSAITAAMMCGEDAARDPARRYWAAIVSGGAYLILAFCAPMIVAIAAMTPSILIATVAGLALVPAFVSALSAGFQGQDNLEAPAMTFLVVASGMSFIGISSAFWGIVIGLFVWGLKALRGKIKH